MSRKKRAIFIAVWLALIVLTLVGTFLIGSSGGDRESIKDVMRDAVLHGDNRVSLFGIKDVDPAFISAVTVTAVLLALAAVIRVFFIPRFKMIPGKFQLVLEELVGFLITLQGPKALTGICFWADIFLPPVLIFSSARCLSFSGFRW